MKQIKTKRLRLALATPNDLPALEKIEEECDEYFRFDPPSAADSNRSLRECMSIGDRIPGISKAAYRRENYCLYCIHKEDVPIGWLSLYRKYLRKDAAYLCVFYIREAYRKSGLGTEILEAITQKLRADQYKTVHLHCSLRDATALRFWVKNGFTEITGVECDGNLFPENFGGIALMMNLDT